MTIDTETLALLKKHGFKWYKNQTTDAVEAGCIADVTPAANGFTVTYNEQSVIAVSTATVTRIEMPENLNTHWIFVHWGTITDQPRA